MTGGGRRTGGDGIAFGRGIVGGGAQRLNRRRFTCGRLVRRISACSMRFNMAEQQFCLSELTPCKSPRPDWKMLGACDEERNYGIN